jgi:long-chain acyl-CoA synthetase
MLDPTQPPVTIAEMAHRTFAEHTEAPFLGTKDKVTKSYKFANYGQVAMRIRHVTGGLMKLGVLRGDRCSILAENCAEWAIADLACQMLGAISVPMFATLPASQVKGILADSRASLIFVSNAAQRSKIDAIRAELPHLKHLIAFEAPAAEAAAAEPTGEDTKPNAAPTDAGSEPTESTSTGDTLASDTSETTSATDTANKDEAATIVAQTATEPLQLLSFAALEALGEAHLAENPTDYEMTWPAAATDDIATIIYTSGTTGEPKGVMLTQRNLLSNVEGIIRELALSHEDSFLSFLPLCHIYERTAGFYLPLRLGASIAYCESLFTVDKNLREVQPTFMFCVPRLYESMREKLYSAADALPDSKKSKYLDALRLAQKAGAAKGQMPGAPGLGFIEQIKYKLYDMAVYSKIRDKFGGRLRAFVSGGAPMAPELGALLIGIGLTTLEGYGLTETSPVIAVNRPGRIRLGTVGEIMGNVKVRIAEDGEILVHAPSVMKGYWDKPEATKAAIDAEGWFHTGDIGTVTDNYLKITDRKKDLLVLANGKKVAPAPIELRLCESRYISQVVLLGDKQKAVTALIVPNMDAVREHGAKNNAGVETDEDLLKSPVINKLFKHEIDILSNDLADFERIKKFTLLAQPFTTESGELTPTLKIKRNVVAQKYAALASE